MIQRNKDKKAQEYKLIKKLWSLLTASQDEKGDIYYVDLKIALAAILNIKEQTDETPISQIKLNNMHSQFLLFYINKMSQKNAENNKAHDDENMNYSYKPKLSKATINLASKSRTKRQELLRTTLSETELTIEKKGRNQLSDHLTVLKRIEEKNRAINARKKEFEDLKMCTFKPQITKYAQKTKNTRDLSKCKKRKLDITTEQREYEKQKKELKFIPQILK